MNEIGMPFADRVPREVRANLKWRQKIHRKVAEDPGYAEAIKEACAVDPVFFLNGFAWTYDPRSEPFRRVPFILYEEFQDDAIIELVNAIGDHDLLIEKSRDMGASWLCISAFYWKFLFSEMCSFLLGSRVESYVDDSMNPKSLFWKVDFLQNNLPAWLQPAGFNPGLHRRKLHIENPENGSVIDGESTNVNFARGDRRTAILLDEFAAAENGGMILNATRDATNCRIFNSTPLGVANAFYEVRQSECKRLRLHWTSHKVKAAGLYTSGQDGKLKVLDPLGFPKDFTPILDGKIRSPWYDLQCKRSTSPQQIAQELDISYLGSGFQFFASEIITKKRQEYGRQPTVIGDLEYDNTTAEPIRFTEHKGGNLRLWFLPDRDNNPPAGLRREDASEYVIGVDIAAGTGSSNSCISIWSKRTCEKVAEYVSPYIRPEQLGKQAVALARWFWQARLGWESNGPGRQFGSRVMELGYGNIYYRRREEAISKKTSEIPGWASTKENKLVLLGNYRAGIETDKCINRSIEAMDETLEYVFKANGGVEHAKAEGKDDPSGAGASHGDRVIADAIGFMLIEEYNKPHVEKKEPVAPVGSLAWRQKQAEKEANSGSRELDSSWR